MHTAVRSPGGDLPCPSRQVARQAPAHEQTRIGTDAYYRTTRSPGERMVIVKRNVLALALATALCAGTAAHAANVQDTGDQATQSADSNAQVTKKKKAKV